MHLGPRSSDDARTVPWPFPAQSLQQRQLQSSELRRCVDQVNAVQARAQGPVVWPHVHVTVTLHHRHRLMAEVAMLRTEAVNGLSTNPGREVDREHCTENQLEGSLEWRIMCPCWMNRTLRVATLVVELGWQIVVGECRRFAEDVGAGDRCLRADGDSSLSRLPCWLCNSLWIGHQAFTPPMSRYPPLHRLQMTQRLHMT
mmetsp:Transcript_75316/g.178932  ORF Transcript_75316/g.178932 Transcript_75316/m.178932 type:complete len:200 (+) Transcript_75316:376-975(+)